MGGLSIEARLLQPEIPFGWPIGIVDQHQRRVVPEAVCLFDHRLLVLPHEARAEEASNRCDEWHVIEDVPGGDYIDAAGGRRDWGDCGQAGEPLISATNGFEAAVRKDKIDGGGDRLTVDPEQFVRRAVA